MNTLEMQYGATSEPSDVPRSGPNAGTRIYGLLGHCPTPIIGAYSMADHITRVDGGRPMAADVATVSPQADYESRAVFVHARKYGKLLVSTCTCVEWVSGACLIEAFRVHTHIYEVDGIIVARALHQSVQVGPVDPEVWIIAWRCIDSWRSGLLEWMRMHATDQAYDDVTSALDQLGPIPQ